MKKSTSIIILSALAALMSLSPARSVAQAVQPKFEGAITFSVTVPQLGDEKLAMITYIKGNKTATIIDMGAMGSQHMYSDLDKRTIAVVSGEGKTGIIMDLPNDTAVVAKAVNKVDNKSDTKADNSDLKATGKIETVNGYKAQEFIAPTKTGSMDIWATTDLPESVRSGMIASMKNNPQSQGSGAFAALATKGLAPVRITIITGGQTAATVDLVKFEVKPIDDAAMVPAPGVTLKHMTMEEIQQMSGGGAH